jgi:hypothetical protein
LFSDEATDVFNVKAYYNLRTAENKAAIDKNINKCKTVEA